MGGEEEGEEGDVIPSRKKEEFVRGGICRGLKVACTGDGSSEGEGSRLFRRE